MKSTPHTFRAAFIPRAFLQIILGLVALASTPSLRAAATAMNEFGIVGSPHNYSDPNAYCDQIIASGVKWIRMSPEWGGIETSNGVYDTTFLANLDNVVNRLHAGGVNILWILCYTAPWASSQPSAPIAERSRYKPANWADWEDYVTFIVTRYNGKISHWEVWNEPDHSGFWKSSVADYYTLLQKAHAKIKLVNPANTVVLGGLAMHNGTGASYGLGTFFDTLMGLGAGGYFDVTNYHAYGTYADHVNRHSGMVDVINKYSIGAKPMWITETGYSTSGDTTLEAYKADMVNQIHLGNLRWADVDRYFWYRLNNITFSTPNPYEENFGLVGTTLSPLAAFRHFQALDGAETDFAKQAAYPSLYANLHTLYYYPAPSGDGASVTASGNDRVIAANTYMYLRVNDAWLYDGNAGVDNTVYVDLTYLDSGTSSFAVQYDGTTNAYSGFSQPRANTGAWKTVTYTINDAKFANRQNYSADLRIYSGGSQPLTVRKVVVRKSYNPATVVLGSNPVYKLMTYFSATSGEAQNAVATIGGIPCRTIANNSKYLYFRVSDALIRTGDTNVTFAVRFWNAGTDNLGIQYNATTNNYKTVNIAKTNTNAWRTVWVTVTDAKFSNAQNNQADFRLSNGQDGSVEYVCRVDVTAN